MSLARKLCILTIFVALLLDASGVVVSQTEMVDHERVQNFGLGNHNRVLDNYAGELSKGYEHVDGPPGGGLLNSFAETDGDFAIAYTITETPWR